MNVQLKPLRNHYHFGMMVQSHRTVTVPGSGLVEVPNGKWQVPGSLVSYCAILVPFLLQSEEAVSPVNVFS